MTDSWTMAAPSNLSPTFAPILVWRSNKAELDVETVEGCSGLYRPCDFSCNIVSSVTLTPEKLPFNRSCFPQFIQNCSDSLASMMASHSSFLLAVAAFFISTTNAGPDEIVFLNNCVAPDGHLFSIAAYFGSTSPWRLSSGRNSRQTLHLGRKLSVRAAS